MINKETKIDKGYRFTEARTTINKETLLTTTNEQKPIKCYACLRKVNKVWWINSNGYCGYCINIEITHLNSSLETRECDDCGKAVPVIFQTIDNKMLCKSCKRDAQKENELEIKPTAKDIGFIIMNIAQLDCGGLLDMDRGKREYYKTIKELQKCGWFLKEEKIFLKGAKEFDDLGYKAVYKLLYIGKKKCKRFPLICWPLNYVHCSDNMCSGHKSMIGH